MSLQARLQEKQDRVRRDFAQAERDYLTGRVEKLEDEARRLKREIEAHSARIARVEGYIAGREILNG